MNTLPKYILLIILIGTLFSCTSSNKFDNINRKLVGTWILDSVSTPSGKYYKATTSSIFNLKDGSDYSHEWMSDDVGGNETGKYTITINPKRAVATLSFIPNIKITHKDTIRIRYLNFDIIEFSSDRLHIVEQTEFIERKGLPSFAFNKHCIYKRGKLK